MTDTLVMCT